MPSFEVLGLASCHFGKKQVRFHRMGGGVFVGQRPPPSSLAPCLYTKSGKKQIPVYLGVYTHTPPAGGKNKSDVCGASWVLGLALANSEVPEWGTWLSPSHEKVWVLGLALAMVKVPQWGTWLSPSHKKKRKCVGFLA